MDRNKEPRDFDIQEVPEEDSVTSHTSYGGEVDTWMRVNTVWEERQWRLACWTMGLLTAWLLSGLVAFLISGNVWVLTGLWGSTGVLAIPVKKIFDHYFRERRQ